MHRPPLIRHGSLSTPSANGKFSSKSGFFLHVEVLRKTRFGEATDVPCFSPSNQRPCRHPFHLNPQPVWHAQLNEGVRDDSWCKGRRVIMHQLAKEWY